MTDVNTYLAMLLIGQTVPPLSDIINKHVPSAKIRLLASMLVSLVISMVLNFQRLAFGSVEETLISSLILFASGQGEYQFYYKDSQWQSDIRFSSKNLPLMELIPPVERIAPKLAALRGNTPKPQ